MNRTEELQALIDRVWRFDHYYMYSDDHYVWRRGEAGLDKLQKDIKAMEVTTEEVEQIMEEIGRRSDKHYLDARAKYTSVAVSPLWNEGDGPQLKHMVRRLFA